MTTPSSVILLVEDDEGDIIFLKRAFGRVGLQATLRVAQTGRMAVDYLAGAGDYADREAHPLPTHVLLDLKLPEKSGLEILEWMRSQPGLSHVRVSILTSSSESQDLRRARELGADCYLVKPMGFNILVELARSIDGWVRTGHIPEECCWPKEPAPAKGSSGTESHPL